MTDRNYRQSNRFQVPDWILEIIRKLGKDQDVLTAVKNLNDELDHNSGFVYEVLIRELHEEVRTLRAKCSVDIWIVQEILDLKWETEVGEDSEPRYFIVTDEYYFVLREDLKHFERRLVTPIDAAQFRLQVAFTPAYIWWGTQKYRLEKWQDRVWFQGMAPYVHDEQRHEIQIVERFCEIHMSTLSELTQIKILEVIANEVLKSIALHECQKVIS